MSGMNPSVAPTSSARQAGSLDADGLNRRALDRLGRGDILGALDDLGRAVELQADHAPAWNNRGIVLQTLGRPGEAVAHFDRALAVRPAYAEALSNRGRARQALGDLAGSREDFDRAVACAAERDWASVLHNRGALRQACGDLTGALADFDLALTVDPEHRATYSQRGLVRKELGDLDGARADLDRALERDHCPAAVYHARGGVRVLQGDFAGAIADYDRALALEPENACFYLSRGHARYHRRDGRGVVDYRMAFRLDPAGAAREVLRVLAEGVASDGAAVLDNCDRHLRLSDRDVIARVRRGLTLLLLGRSADAAPDLRRARETVPEMAPHLDWLAELAGGQGGETAGGGAEGTPASPGAVPVDAVFASLSPGGH